MGINNSGLYVGMKWLPDIKGDFNELLDQCINSNDPSKCFSKLSRMRLNLNQINKLSSSVLRLKQEGLEFKSFTKVNLGVVSNHTTSFISPSLIVAALRYEILLGIYEAPYGQVIQVASGSVDIFKDTKLDMILLSVDYNGLPIHGKLREFGLDSELPYKGMEYIKNVKTKLSKKYKVPCIMQTCAHSLESIFGSIDIITDNTDRQIISDFNRLLTNYVKNNSGYLLDVSTISEIIGLENWHDSVMYNMAKIPFSQKAVPLYADHVCRIISSVKGKSKKAIVLDLDNTLWGGVIGDDGLTGILLGQGDMIGEAYTSFQKTILKLNKRGVLLAVSSKNERNIAKEVFLKHPDMVLSLDNITVFRANWRDKVSNIKAIAAELNLGLDALVFVDDNPVERDIIREFLPEVAVLELPSDPACYSQTLLAAGYFDTVYYTDEDKNRISGYKSNFKRTELFKNTQNYGDYLKSLDMKASISSFDSVGLKRITQLISKTNQFNLTTYRYSEDEIYKMIDNDDYYTLQVRLTDSFSDHGVVSVVICIKNTNEWLIDSWVMSCRVFERGLEYAIFDIILKSAKSRNISTIIGKFIPTDRNNVVKDLYQRLGFSKKSTDKDNVSYSLDISNLNFKHNNNIKVEVI